MPWFFGKGFEEVTVFLQLEAPVLVLMSIETAWVNAFLLASRREKSVTIVTTIATLLHVALNCFLVVLLGTKGAIYALLLTEGLLAVVTGWQSREDFSAKNFFSGLFRYLLLASIMGAVVFWVGLRLPQTIATTGLLIVLGCAVYGVSLVLIRDPNVIYLLKQIFGKGAINRGQ